MVEINQFYLLFSAGGRMSTELYLSRHQEELHGTTLTISYGKKGLSSSIFFPKSIYCGTGIEIFFSYKMEGGIEY